MLLCVLAVLTAGSLRADTTEVSSGGSTATLTYTYNYTLSRVEWSAVLTKGGSPAPVVWGYRTTGPGGSYGDELFVYNASPTGNGTSSGHFSLAPGSYIRIGCALYNPGQIALDEDYFTPGVASYGITFELPANNTMSRRDYVATQNGEQVAVTSQGSGAASRDWYIGGLETDDDVSVSMITGGPVLVDDDGNVGVVPGETETTPVGAATAPSSETTPGSGATATGAEIAPPAGPAPSNPDVPGPDAPTGTTAPSAPTSTTSGTQGTGPTPFTASGTGGVTKEDAENIANKQLEGIESVNDTVKSTGDATKNAVDKVATAVWEAGKKNTEAVDKAATAVWDSGTKVVEAVNKVRAAVDLTKGELSGKLTTIANRQTTTNEKLDEIKTAIEAQGTDTEAAQTAADAATATAATNSTTAISAMSGIVTTAPTALGYTPDTTGSGSFMSITMPPEFGGATVNFNPFAEGRMAPLAAWLRAATQWAILGLLGYYIFTEIKATFGAAGASQQAKGNTIAAGTGGQATSLIAAGLITAAMVALATGLFAWGFNGITAGVLVTNMTTNPLVAVPANIIWVIDQVFPVATAIAAFIARVSFPLYSTALYATYNTVVRFIVP